MEKMSELDIELLIDDYTLMEVGGHITLSYAENVQWVHVNAELAARGLAPMKDYVLQKTAPAYPGVKSFSLSRLTATLPGERKGKKEKKGGTGKPGAPSQFDRIVEDALVELLTGRTETLDVSTGWSGQKRKEAYGTALFVVAQLSGNN